MGNFFENFDFTDFWKNSEYARKSYIEASPTPAGIEDVERRLGYRLPGSYIELARHQNGGVPRDRSHRTRGATSWASDHIAISGIFSIGDRKDLSLCGKCGSLFWIEMWGYPPIGVYFAECPSAGHDMICLDYRLCGPDGEPQVVHVDQELGYKITFVAENFEAFIRGLENGEIFR